ncbi:MAG: helix-turn-helix domain-containing protein, partial [archaeon GB-1867-035]|nr:helix-turn-helix domain-containing protein [Candidatus Culexmicrobium profundum]
MTMEKRLLSTGEVCKLLGITHNTVYRYIKIGIFKPIKLPSGTWRIPREQVIKLLEQGKVEPEEESKIIEIITPEQEKAPTMTEQQRKRIITLIKQLK